MSPRLFFLFLSILTLSCERKRIENEVRNEVKTEIHPLDSVSPHGNINIDSSKQPVPVAAARPAPIQILFTGTFHGDEVEEGAEELPWLGLLQDEDENFVLTRTNVVSTRVVDGLLDDPEKGEKTGWEITTEDNQFPTMLITGGDFQEGKVEAGEVPATLYPGDSAHFAFKGVQYLLYATGSSRLDSVSGVNYVSDYSLFIASTEQGQSRKTLLVSHASFDDAMTSILWSGDLDGDGYIDFLIDLSNHYNQRLPTLFLSKPATSDKIVVPVAGHSSVGC